MTVDGLVPSGGAFGFEISTIDGDRAHITLTGRFDVVEAFGVREGLADERLARVRHLTIDLAEVTFVDSAGLAVLARTRRNLVRGGGSLTLVRPVLAEAMRVFRLTQFDQIFRMVDRDDSVTR